METPDRSTTVATIATDRLILRPMVAGDADVLLGIFGDPEVMASFDTPPFGLEQMRGWVARNLAHQAAHGYGLWVVERRADGQVIGDCGLEWQSVDGVDLPELGYDLRRDAWGHGYATEAARAVRDHAFGPLDLTRLVSVIRQVNTRSAAVARRVGMHHASSLQRGPVVYHVYQIDRDTRTTATPSAN
jgi:RimJ/RimL family protein N-acetyltransferase